MLNIIHSTTLYAGGQILCAACFCTSEDYLSANNNVSISTDCFIYHDGNAYDKDGDTSEGVPSIQETHFYYPIK
jgi:hypothetical protein